MQEEKLLAAKAITNAHPIFVAMAVGVNGSSWRYRISVETKDMNLLLKPFATAPNAVVRGRGSSGLIITLDPNTGTRLNLSSPQLIGIMGSARDLALVENRVPQSKIQAVLVEYEDKTAAIITLPLPDNFVTPSTRSLRRTHPEKSLAVEKAFTAAGLGTMYEAMYTPLPVTPLQVAPPTPAPEPAFVPPATHIANVTNIANVQGQDERAQVPVKTADMKELIAMINAERQRLAQEGTSVTLRVDGTGLLRAAVAVVVEQEL